MAPVGWCTPRFAHVSHTPGTQNDVYRPTGRPFEQHRILFSVVVYVVVIQPSGEERRGARKSERERENERRVEREGRRPNV
jgi:hypothetical protein